MAGKSFQLLSSPTVFLLPRFSPARSPPCFLKIFLLRQGKSAGRIFKHSSIFSRFSAAQQLQEECWGSQNVRLFYLYFDLVYFIVAHRTANIFCFILWQALPFPP